MSTENENIGYTCLHPLLLAEIYEADKNFKPFLFIKKLTTGYAEGKLSSEQYDHLSKELNIICDKFSLDLDASREGGVNGMLLLELTIADKNFNPYSFAKRVMLGLNAGHLTESQYRRLIKETQRVCIKLDIDKAIYYHKKS